MRVGHASPPLTYPEQLAWLRLIRSPQIGPIKFWRFLTYYGTATAALTHLAKENDRALCSVAAAEAEWAAVQKYGARFAFYGDAHYPRGLLTLTDAPPLLTLKGLTHWAQSNGVVAFVGARNASVNGQRFTTWLAKEVGQHQVVIISGLARGIDTAAHTATLATGTIAVLAGGIDVIYPPENKTLHQTIAEQGLLISEAPLGAMPQPTQFARRNRLISGCALGVVVVEAGMKSGSLITARFALEQGREVMAVPGSPYDARHQGCNQLLRQGAGWAESPRDVLEMLDQVPKDRETKQPTPLPPTRSKAAPFVLDKVSDKILTALGGDGLAVDQLIRHVELSSAQVLEVLTDLELTGQVTWEEDRVMRVVG